MLVVLGGAGKGQVQAVVMVVLTLTVPVGEELLYHLQAVHGEGGYKGHIITIRGGVILVVQEEEVCSVVGLTSSPELIALVLFIQLCVRKDNARLQLS